MDTISLVERGMTDAECARMNPGFDEHTREQDNPSKFPIGTILSRQTGTPTTPTTGGFI